jgi:sugar phosphate isomerase/epimerase
LSLSLASARLDDAGDRLAPAVEVARALGFQRVHASAPPPDVRAALQALDASGVSLTGLDAPVGRTTEDALARAVASAAALRTRQVVLESPRVEAERPAAREAGVDALARALHGVLSREPGLSVAVRNAAGERDLVGLVEAEWLLSELRRRPVGLWLVPWRAEAGPSGAKALDWADRFGSRLHGVALHGAPGPKGPDLPPAAGVDWVALGALLPARAARVLEVGPHVPDASVVEARRRFEESLAY